MRKKIAFSRIFFVFLLLVANGVMTLVVGQVLTSGGGGHTLHICSDGRLSAWGQNDSMQLGNASGNPSVIPLSLPISGQFTSVAAGKWHSLALRQDGTVWSWGANGHGQLGDSTRRDTTGPVQVAALAGIIAISTFEQHGLALRSDSSLWAWGRNNKGQLGNNTQLDTAWPIRVDTHAYIKIAAGRYFSMALRADGTVWAWGDNIAGQVGTGLGDTVLVPIQVQGIDSIVAIAAGADHALALRKDGTLWAWGNNSQGQLGQGNLVQVIAPQQVPDSASWVAMACGTLHSLAQDANGQLWAWGTNTAGQLGDSTTNTRLLPTRIPSPGAVQAISTGHLQSWIQLSDGRLFASGQNVFGALGDGSFRDSYFPTKVIGLCETTSTTKDDAVTEVFHIAPGDSLRWKAGEIASSIAFSSGKRIWFMGPSILDSLRGDTTIPCTGNTVANWVLIQDSLRGPLYSPTNAPLAPSILPYFRDSFPHDTSYVPGAAYVLDTTIHVILSAFTSGSFAGTYHARMGIGTVTLLDITKDNDSIIGIDVGKAVLIDSTNGLPYLYLYGTKRDGGLTSPIRPYLARRNLHAVPGIYEYKAKTGWSTSPADAYHISGHVVDSAFSVLALDGRYALITQYVDPSVPASSGNAMIALVADSLWGPFGDERLLYVAPDSFGPTPSSANTQPLLASGAVVHENCGDLLVSYNVDLPDPDSCDVITGRLADTWRPKFLRIPLLQVDSQMQRGPVPDFSSTQIGNTVQFHSLGPAIQELMWDFGDGDFSTLHDPVHTYLLPGNYIVTLQANCGTISQQSDTLQMGGNSLTMTAYPNPNSGSFTLEAWGLDSSKVTLRVMSLMGQVVFQQEYELEVGRIMQSFPTVDFLPLSGAYILQVLQGENTLERLIVVTH